MKKRNVFTLLAVALSLFSASTIYAEKVKLTVWGIDIPDDDPNHSYAKALVTTFQDKYPDITLDWVALGNDPLKDKVKVTMASGSGLPDVMQGWGGSVMGGYADAGNLLDISAAAKKIPISPAAASAMTWKGKVYGVAPIFAVAGVFVNDGIFKANNLKYPDTIEGFEAVCEALKAKGIQPFACGVKDKWPALALYMYLTDRFGGKEAFVNAATRKGAFDADPFVKAAQLYQKWVKAGYFGATPLGEAYGDAQQLIATGKAAMHLTGSWMCGTYSSKDFTDQTISFHAFPALKSGGKGPATDIMGMTDIGFIATKAAKGKEDAVAKFLAVAASPEVVGASGRLSGVPGVTVKNALVQQAAAVFATAKNVTFWWDQDLPPTVTSPLNDTIQTFFLPDTDVKKALTAYEATVIDAMGAVKK
jgi:raffinose/stachyose/melibiose transport system substrate-binding protein